MHIILVSVGNFQEYILDNINNLLEYGNKDIIVLTEFKFFEKFVNFPLVTLVDVSKLNDYGFDKSSHLDKSFRNGFWHLCSLRLFYVYSVIEERKLTNCLHIENDVTIYCDLTEVKLFNSNKVCCVFDNLNRVIPSVVYIPDSNKFKPIIDGYDNSKNDMQNLARFGEDIIERLPIYLPTMTSKETAMITKNFYRYGWIFDGAAIGQYLGGVDERNIEGDTRGFVNNDCVIRYDNSKFYWIPDKKTKLYRPYICINEIFYPVFNLHVHSKKLNNFLGRKPIERKFINMLML